MSTTNETTPTLREVEEEISRLRQIFEEYPLARLEKCLKECRLSTIGTRQELIDRLVRFDIKRTFVSSVVRWDAATDQARSSDGNLWPFMTEWSEGEDSIELTERVVRPSENLLMDLPVSGDTPPMTHQSVSVSTNTQIDRNVRRDTTSTRTTPSAIFENPIHSSTIVPPVSIPNTGAIDNEQVLRNNSNGRLPLSVNAHVAGASTDPTADSRSRRSSVRFGNVTTHGSPSDGGEPVTDDRRNPENNPPAMPPWAMHPYFYQFPLPHMYPYAFPHPAIGDASGPNVSFPNTSFDASQANGQMPTGWPPAYSSFVYPNTPTNSKNTLQRQAQLSNILQQWKVSFEGALSEDVEEFITRIRECMRSMTITDADILQMVPAILTEGALHWARPLHDDWKNVQDFATALRRRYGVPDFHTRLDNEIRARTQGSDEPIGSYLSGIRFLMDKTDPRMSLNEQLDRAYRNLNPAFGRRIQRKQFENFDQLQELGQQEEVQRERERAYRPPPPPETCLFPNAAYVRQRKTRMAAIETSEPTKGIEVIAAIGHDSNVPPMPPKNQMRKAQVNARRNGSGSTLPNKETHGSYNQTAEPRDTANRAASPHNTLERAKSPSSKVTFENRAYPCWLCKEEGHWAKNCPKHNDTVCYQCGKPGYTRTSCPECTKLSEN